MQKKCCPKRILNSEFEQWLGILINYLAINASESNTISMILIINPNRMLNPVRKLRFTKPLTVERQFEFYSSTLAFDFKVEYPLIKPLFERSIKPRNSFFSCVSGRSFLMDSTAWLTFIPLWNNRRYIF